MPESPTPTAPETETVAAGDQLEPAAQRLDADIFDTAATVPALLAQLAGISSMCWEFPGRAGVFDSDLADEAVNLAWNRLLELDREAPGLGMATNAQLKEELRSREESGHTDDNYRTFDGDDSNA